MVLFWGGTARGAGVTAIAKGIGVLVFCCVNMKTVYLVPATSFARGRLFEFFCLLEMKDVSFFWSHCSVFLLTRYLLFCATVGFGHVFAALPIVYTH